MLELLSYGGLVLLLAGLVVNRSHPRLSDVFYASGSFILTAWSVMSWVPAFIILNSVCGAISLFKLIRGRNHAVERS